MLVSLRQCAILILICMLLLLGGQTGEPWDPSKKQRPIVKRRALDMNVLLLSRYTVNLKCSLNFDVIRLANFCVYLSVFFKAV